MTFFNIAITFVVCYFQLFLFVKRRDERERDVDIDSVAIID